MRLIHSKVFRSVYVLTIIVLLTGCHPTVQTPAVATIPPTATRSAAPTETQSPTIFVPPSATPLPTATPSPTSTPLPTATPSVWGSDAINARNAALLAQRARWGRGSVSAVQRVGQSDLTAVLTPLGLYLYRLPAEQPVKFIADAARFAFSDDGSLLATSSSGSRVELWQVADLDEPVSLAFDTQPHSITWDACLLDDDCQRYYLESFFIERDSVQGMNFSPDGTRLAVSYGDNRIALWQTLDGRQVQVLSDPAVIGTSRMAFSPDGRYLAGSGKSNWGSKNDLSVWRLEDGALMRYVERAGSLSERPFSADGNFVVTGVRGFMVLWNTPFLESPRWLAATHTDDIRFSEDGSTLLLNGGVELRRYPDGILLPQPTLPPDALPDLAQLAALGHFVPAGLRVLPGGELIAWGAGLDQPLTVWRLPEGKPEVLAAAGAALNLPAISPDGRWLAYCSTAGLMLIDLPAGTQAWINTCTQGGSDLHSNRSSAPQVFLSNQVLARGEQTQLSLLSVPEGDVIHNLFGHTQNLVALAISPDGTRMVSTTLFEHTRSYIEIAGWDLTTPTRLFRTNWPLANTPGMDFSPDNRVLAVATGRVRFYIFDQARLYKEVDLPLDTRLAYPGQQPAPFNAVQSAYSPDGALLAVGDASGNLHLLDSASGEVLASIPVGQAAVSALAFDRNGANIAVACADGTVSLWGVGE